MSERTCADTNDELHRIRRIEAVRAYKVRIAGRLRIKIAKAGIERDRVAEPHTCGYAHLVGQTDGYKVVLRITDKEQEP